MEDKTKEWQVGVWGHDGGLRWATANLVPISMWERDVKSALGPGVTFPLGRDFFK